MVLRLYMKLIRFYKRLLKRGRIERSDFNDRVNSCVNVVRFDFVLKE